MKKSCFLVSAFLILLPCVAEAAGAAGALFGVKGVVVDPVVFPNKKIATDCGLSADTFQRVVKSALQTSGVPAILQSEVDPDTITPAHIDVVPEISSLNNQGFDCTSWLTLSAQTYSNVLIAPIDILRNVRVVYWQEGSLIESSQAVHERNLEDEVQKMVGHFADQFKSDQNPSGKK